MNESIMADDKDLPVKPDLFVSYGQTNSLATTNETGGGGNSSRTSSSNSNFNPLVTAVGFNPMTASGYATGASTMAAYYSPFSFLPYPNPSMANASAYMNALPNVLSGGAMHSSNAVWPGMLPPDYLLNVAALQHLHQQPSLVGATSALDGHGETFSDVLKKMPKAPAAKNANGPNVGNRNPQASTSFSHGNTIPRAAAVRTPSSSKLKANMPKSKKLDTPATITTASKPSSSSISLANSFSATSLAMSDQKVPSRSSASASITPEGGHDSSSILHSNSLATLAEIASTLQNGDRPRSSKDKEKVKREPKSLPADIASSQESTSDRRHPVNGAPALDFSRKRQSIKMNGGFDEGGTKMKESKLDPMPSSSSTKYDQSCRSSTAKLSDQSCGSDRSLNRDTIRKTVPKGPVESQGRRQPDTPSNDHNAVAAASNLFGSSLSSDLKMDPTLLNASAMAWAALSNQWLLANMQNDLLNRAAAFHQQRQVKSGIVDGPRQVKSGLVDGPQQRQMKSIVASGHQRSSSKSPATAGAPLKKSQEGSNHGILATTTDAVDVTIDAVIKQHQNDKSTREKGRSGLRPRRGRGSRGGITVREQLAARRGSDWSVTSGVSGCSDNVDTVPSSELVNSLDDDKKSIPQSAALDLSLKSSASHTPASFDSISDSKVSNGGAASAGIFTNGISTLHADDERRSTDQSTDSAVDPIGLSRKRVLPDTDCLRLPVVRGWRRQTYIRTVSSSCIRGDVIYYAPCGKRIGSYAEVLRYLNKHCINDLDRNNFSFSSKVLVGEFLQVKPDGVKSGIVKLSEKEVVSLYSSVYGAGITSGERPVRRALSDAVKRPRRVISKRTGAARRYPHRLPIANSWKNDLQAVDQSSCEFKRSDHQSEERRRKLDLMRNQKVMEAMQRAKEKEMRERRMASMKKQEHEKLRQQLLFSRVFEGRRRQDEKERLYAEKLIRREERLAARTATLMKLRQMRQPTEDMELEEPKDLPTLNRIQHVALDGQAFADLLMVMEFINNFGHVLKIDNTEIPSVSDVHAGLLNDRHGVGSLRSLLKTLLLLVLEYPGLPSGVSGKTISGHPAKDVGVTDMNMSELLRMFLMSRDEQGKEFGHDLTTRPFEALPPSRKAAILAYLCNELLYCRNVVREIEGNIEVIAKLKSDRWSLEGKLRHMKVVRASKGGISGNTEKKSDDTALVSAVSQERPTNQDEDDDDGDSSDSDGKGDSSSQQTDTAKVPARTLFGITAGEIESISKEEKMMPVEEVDKELERLSKEMHDLRTQVNEVQSRVRASPFGQDRYNRYYWVLPHYTGVFVEGVESGGVNNPAVKLAPASSPVHASSTTNIHSPKEISPVRSCIQDLVEAVSRSACKEEAPEASEEGSPYAFGESSPSDDLERLENMYEIVKLEKINSAGDDWDQHKIMNSAKTIRIGINKKMRPIPLEMQQGWWLIDGPGKLDAIPSSLHHRGIRERILNRVLTKYGECIRRTAFQTGKGIMKLDPVSAAEESKPETVALRAARKLLNMTRQLEDKVFQANVHIKGWKPVDADEASPSGSVDDGTSNDSSCDSSLDASDKYILYSTDQLLTVVKDRLVQLESNIERRYLMPAFNRDATKLSPMMKNGTISLQSVSIEKPDDVGSHSRHSTNNDDDDDQCENEDDDVPLALERWRSGVAKAWNIAQLSMCLEELDAQVAWEKSVMKASCQICRGGDDESQLLLCDGCDMGYHTYCFKPKLDTVPEGDWFCPQCIAKATRRPCCLLCCRQASRPMITCSHCSKDFHLDCLPSPLKKIRNGSWSCGGCTSNKKRQPKRSTTPGDDNRCSPSTSTGQNTDPSQPKKKPPKKSQASAASITRLPSVDVTRGPLDLNELCSIMLAELDAHKDAGPFRSPVDTKVCPLYKKVIKQPMDLSTIRCKLSGQKYENESQFMSDVKLMFDNCRTFNEDDSPIGKAGHALRRYFSRRWKELKESTGKKSS